MDINQATTKQLVDMYTKANRFKVFVTKSPDTLRYCDFKKYDAVLSNWNAWPEGKLKWPKSTKKGLMKYIKRGGGFVLFHAASAAFYEWEDFHKLISATWENGVSTHGKITQHQIVIKDNSHPITKGISDFWITDELWVNVKTQPNINLLAESYSDPKNNGSGKMEPVFLWNKKGLGRCFNSILGHNAEALQNSYLKTILLRGTEWAATGNVTLTD